MINYVLAAGIGAVSSNLQIETWRCIMMVSDRYTQNILMEIWTESLWQRLLLL